MREGRNRRSRVGRVGDFGFGGGEDQAGEEVRG